MAVKVLKRKKKGTAPTAVDTAVLGQQVREQAVAIEKLSRLISGAQVRYNEQQGEIAAWKMRVALLEGVVGGLQAVLDEMGERARPWLLDEVDPQTGEVFQVSGVLLPQGCRK